MKSRIIGIVAVVALVLSVLGVMKSPGTIERVVERLGSAPGPDFTSEYIAVNEVRVETRSTSFRTGTTTVCALKSPSATSTLILGSMQNETATSAAMVYRMAKSDTPFATTTRLGSHNVVASDKVTVLASTTPTAGANDVVVFAPNKYLVMSMETPGQGANATNILSGQCKALFVVN